MYLIFFLFLSWCLGKMKCKSSIEKQIPEWPVLVSFHSLFAYRLLDCSYGIWRHSLKGRSSSRFTTEVSCHVIVFLLCFWAAGVTLIPFFTWCNQFINCSTYCIFNWFFILVVIVPEKFVNLKVNAGKRRFSIVEWTIRIIWLCYWQILGIVGNFQACLSCVRLLDITIDNSVMLPNQQSIALIWNLEILHTI